MDIKKEKNYNKKAKKFHTKGIKAFNKLVLTSCFASLSNLELQWENEFLSLLNKLESL